MSRIRLTALAAAVLASLAAALPALAGAVDQPSPAALPTPDREAAMDPVTPADAVDPALAAWRDSVLPDIRAFLAAEREALASLAAVKSDDPEAERERNRLCEERKLLGEREIALLQLAWAEAHGRAPLAERLRNRVAALEAAWPELPAAAARVYGSGAARIGAP
ncbi:hypothetical protein FJ250_03645, partial [bacterium]|nr:hypothetical protein [bacterium]